MEAPSSISNSRGRRVPDVEVYRASDAKASRRNFRGYSISALNNRGRLELLPPLNHMRLPFKICAR